MSDPEAPAGLLWDAVRRRGPRTVRREAEAMPDLDTFGSGFLWWYFDLTQADLRVPIDQHRLGPASLAETVFSADDHQRVTVEGDHNAKNQAGSSRPASVVQKLLAQRPLPGIAAQSRIDLVRVGGRTSALG